MKPAERTALIARHNLWVSMEEVQRIKRAILEGDLWELVERRCRAHPALLSALRRLGKHQDVPGAVRAAQPGQQHAVHRTGDADQASVPAVRASGSSSDTSIPAPRSWWRSRKPGSRTDGTTSSRSLRSWRPATPTSSWPRPSGRCPSSWTRCIPSPSPSSPTLPTCETKERIREQMEHLSHEHPYALGVAWDGQATIDTLAMMCQKEPSFDMDLARVRAVADYQFGKGAADLLLDGRVEIKKSETTGKIRNVLVDKSISYR